jgi:hypothetical protein
MRCTRQRCQVARNTRATAALMPTCASGITSLTPARPRRLSPRRNSGRKVPASEEPIAMPRTSRRPSVLAATAMVTATDTTRPASRTFTPRSASGRRRAGSGGIDPRIGPVALQRPLEEAPHAPVDVLAQPADLALGDARHALRLDQLVDAAGGDAVHPRVRLCRPEGRLRPPGSPRSAPSRPPAAARGSPGSSCPGSAAGGSSGSEGAAVSRPPRPELGNAQLDRPGTGLPAPVAIPVALSEPLRRALAVAGAGQALDLERRRLPAGQPTRLRSSPGREAREAAARRRSRSSRATCRRPSSSPEAGKERSCPLAGLLAGAASQSERRACWPPLGHRGGLRRGVAGRNPTLPEIPPWPPAMDSCPAYAILVAVAPPGQPPTAPTPPPGT